jgi:dimethylamine/trimethylamine dehydrogenase
MELDATLPVLTPDQLMRDARPEGNRVVIFDDDHYYLGGVIAELLVREGYSVALVTPAATVSSWTSNTLELDRIQRRMLEIDVELHLSMTVSGTTAGGPILECIHTGRQRHLAADSLVMVTSRLPNDALARDLRAVETTWHSHGLLSVTALADALAPSTIAAAVWDGRRFAEDLGRPQDRDVTPFRREVTLIDHSSARSQT